MASPVCRIGHRSSPDVEEAMLKPKHVALIALAALVVSGPLQTMGLLPQTALGDASNSFIKKIADHLAWWRE